MNCNVNKHGSPNRNALFQTRLFTHPFCCLTYPEIGDANFKGALRTFKQQLA